MAFLDIRRIQAIGWLLAVAWGVSQAQQAPLTDVERARRDADSPLRWIKLHADTPAKSPPAKAEPAKPELPKPAPVKPALAKSPLNKASTAAAATSAAVASADAASASAQPQEAKSAAPAPTPAPADDLAPLRRTDPQWDAELMSALRRGRVEVRFTVAAKGTLTAAEVISSTDPQLDGAALSAISQWRFAPMSAAHSASVEFGFDLDRGAIAASEPDLVAIDQAEPQWDAPLMQSLRKGSVRVHFEVGTNGRIASAEIAATSDPQLAAPALAAIRRWRFQPIDRARSVSVDFGFDLDH